MLVMFGAGIMVGILILLALLGLTKREEPAGCVVVGEVQPVEYILNEPEISGRFKLYCGNGPRIFDFNCLCRNARI